MKIDFEPTSSKYIKSRMSSHHPESIVLPTESMNGSTVIQTSQRNQIYIYVVQSLLQKRAPFRILVNMKYSKIFYRFDISQTRMLLSSELDMMSSWRG